MRPPESGGCSIHDTLASGQHASPGPMSRLAPLVIAILLAVVCWRGMARAEEERLDSQQRTAMGFGHIISLVACSSSTLSSQRDGAVAGFHVQPGDQVKKGARLLDFETAPELVTAYQQATAILRLTQSTRARTESLFRQQLATRMDLDNAERAARDAQAILSLEGAKGGATPSETLLAPFDGVVTGVLVAPGDRLEAGAALLTLTLSGANCDND
jgi:multidrug efflux pump subunit AcrA (membrane-fusion protein)